MSVLHLPTPLNQESAWADYVRLANEFESEPERRTDLEFCQQMARAYRRWSLLFLASDSAA